jgi:hypothetical protein
MKTTIDIQLLLEKAYDESFLGAILLLKENEKEYKKTEFYRKTKVNLLELYKNYYTYIKNIYGVSEKILELNEAAVVSKLETILDKMGGSEKLMGLLDKILEKFDIAQLMNQGEEFEKLIKDLKLDELKK